MTQIPKPTMPSAAALLATLVLVAAVSPFVVFAVPQVVGADEGFVVLSGSMEPELSPGDVVIVDAAAPVRVGDVITYRTGGDTVPTTHRVVGERDGGYETKGDANENVDAGLVGPEAIIGRVVLTIPVVGHVILWANTPVGYVALVVTPLVLLGLSELRAWARREPGAEAAAAATADPESDRGRPAADADAPETGNNAAGMDVETSASDASGPASDVGSVDGNADGATAQRSAGTVAVAAVDLKLTLLAMTTLFAYAGWNVYREFAATAAPNPVSVGALTGGLLGLLFAGSVTLAAWRAARAAARRPSTPALTDGSGDVEVGDE
ncbi:signal peptidase I [Halobellus litoreus]|uniref:Signal peptidase I n=1 Tax=Halobellus litoreus TaxID=755310 RepID=A0ABD6DWD1_9EURY|nr:signal peptidase I [Halobellus litoreus]